VHTAELLPTAPTIRVFPGEGQRNSNQVFSKVEEQSAEL
jgi:hypothetical protein